MSYEFALDKKSIISVIAGWIVIGALLFLAGWIVGRQWPTSEAASSPSAAAEEQRATLPSEPLLNDEAPARASLAPRKVNPPPVKGNVTPTAAPNGAAAPARSPRA